MWGTITKPPDYEQYSFTDFFEVSALKKNPYVTGAPYDLLLCKRGLVCHHRGFTAIEKKQDAVPILNRSSTRRCPTLRRRRRISEQRVCCCGGASLRMVSRHGLGLAACTCHCICCFTVGLLSPHICSASRL